MNCAMKPIFILSLPRSGSTLLNRLLGSHTQVATHSEPWMMLPFAYLRDVDAIRSCYSHQSCAKALRDVVSNLEGGENTWHKAIREFVLTIYASLTAAQQKESAKYFLDKTPRYYSIAPFLKQIFPEARFVILLRNPLACLASNITTWGKGTLRLHGQMHSLLEGPVFLAEAIRQFGAESCIVRYEELINSPATELKKIFDYLELEEEPVEERLKMFKLKGGMGDPTGVNEYGGVISKQPTQKYLQILGTPYRKWYCRRFLDRIGSGALDTLGYSRSYLESEISAMPLSFHHLLRDPLEYAMSFLWRITDGRYIKFRLRTFLKEKKLYLMD